MAETLQQEACGVNYGNAFIMPNDAERQRIGVLREHIVEMRPDQIKHFEHLLRSWRIFGSENAIGDTWRAIKRTLRDKP